MSKEDFKPLGNRTNHGSVQRLQPKVTFMRKLTQAKDPDSLTTNIKGRKTKRKRSKKLSMPTMLCDWGLLDIGHSWTIKIGKRLRGQEGQERRETSVALHLAHQYTPTCRGAGTEVRE